MTSGDPRAGDGGGRAAAGGARRGRHAGGRPRRPLGAARAGEDVDAARDAAPPPGDELTLWTAARRAVVGEADYVVEELEKVGEVVAAIGAALGVVA